MLLFFLGETKTLASVSDPIEVRLAAENPSRATFEVSVRPLQLWTGKHGKFLDPISDIARTLGYSILLLKGCIYDQMSMMEWSECQNLEVYLGSYHENLAGAYIKLEKNWKNVQLIPFCSLSLIPVSDLPKIDLLR